MSDDTKPTGESQESRSRLFLIDGYSIIFRAFYALPPLSNSRGEPTNAVYGFVRMLHKLIREEEPDLIAVALDTSKPTVRTERFADYKANRAPMPDDLRSQMPHIRRVIEAMKMPILEYPGYEADDVIGTVTKKAVGEGHDVVLVTADKDFMQLVGDQVTMYRTKREEDAEILDAKGVEEYFGVPPDRVIDVLALMGDSIDNVPGVPGIGEKGAKKLIQEYGSLEELLDRAEEVKRKNYREGLLENREQALLSQELVTIHTDLDVAFESKSFAREDPDGPTLADIYREMEFHTLVEELEQAGLAGGGPEIEPARDCEDVGEWQRLTDDLGSRVVLALVGPDDQTHEGLGVLISDGDEREVLYADFRHSELRQACLESLGKWARRDDIEIVGHDTKEILRLAGFGESREEVAAHLVDTMLQAYLLPSSVRSYDLTQVALGRLARRLVPPSEAGYEKKQSPMRGSESLLRFAAERVITVADLAESLGRELGDPSRLSGDPAGVYSTIEEPLVEVLLRMEQAGIALDTEFLAEMSVELGAKLDALEAEIYEIAGETFNIKSSQQLGTIMFEKLGYPVMKRTRKTKSYSTNAEILESLVAQGFDLPERILSYREYTKLRSTYVDALPELVDENGRLHTSFQQAVAATGRLSSVNPNLQNIPVRSEVGQEIRRAFVAPEGRRLLVADYSQIELRVLAHIAEEQRLIEAFQGGEDIHQSTAALVFGVAPQLVSDEQRRAAKTINFGIIYGMSAFGLSQRLGIARGEAKNFIDAYFEEFPGVRTYTDDTLASVEETGYVETLYGRCRFLPDTKSRNRMLRENARRMAINARIQGTAADLQKLAMIAVDARLRSDFPEALLLLTVHDELVLEVPESRADELSSVLQAEMEGVAELEVPLKVDVGVGQTWYDAKS